LDRAAFVSVGVVKIVMAGQKRVFALDVPGIHILSTGKQEDVDGRTSPAMRGCKVVLRPPWS
jgi:hypothetical protein